MSPRTPPQQVRLYHFTPPENVPNILQSGLLAQLSRGKRQGVWLCSWSLRTWARWHVAEWQDCDAERLIDLHVTVSAQLLTRVREGVYIVMGDIPADQITLKR
jgi:RNA:NAD 2'-phosphotransferase (TPT1/KptA family)